MKKRNTTKRIIPKVLLRVKLTSRENRKMKSLDLPFSATKDCSYIVIMLLYMEQPLIWGIYKGKSALSPSYWSCKASSSTTFPLRPMVHTTGQTLARGP